MLMKLKFKRLIKDKLAIFNADEAGIVSLESAMLGAVASVAIIHGASNVGDSVSHSFDTVADAMTGARVVTVDVVSKDETEEVEEDDDTLSEPMESPETIKRPGLRD